MVPARDGLAALNLPFAARAARLTPPARAAVMMVLAALLFSTMGVCVKIASAQYGTGEIVFYRGLTGALMMALLARCNGGSLLTSLGAMHFWRSASGVVALCLWFYAIGGLPLATAMTLNYMSSVWMALFLVGGAVMLGNGRVDGRLVGTVLLGFAGVACILRPTIEQQQLWHGLMGLLSGMIAATAYLQVTALGRAGEPEYRIVFYFSLGSVGAGLAMLVWSGPSAHTVGGAALLVAIGLLATSAQLLMTRAYAIGRPLVNASLQYLGIAFSFAYGMLFFGDRMTALALGGIMLIIVAGLSATLLRKRSAPSDSINAPTET